MSTTTGCVAVLGVAVLLSGCTASVDKAGSETLVLQFATIDGELDTSGAAVGQVAFLEALEEVSGGRIEVDIEFVYGDSAADAESDLVRAIASGKLDGGWPSTRAFAEAGIAGLGAIEAPLTLTNYDALVEAISGPVGEQVRSVLDDSDVLGLGTTIGELRRPFSIEPLVEPADWEGIRFRSFNSPVQSETIRALGAEPVQTGVTWAQLVEAGELDGAEIGFGIGSLVATGVLSSVTANVVLWPKLAVLSMNRDRFDELTDEQRGWIEEAAAIAVKASAEASYDESEFVERTCASGIRVVTASDAAVEALRREVQPVIDAIAADPAERELLDAVEAVAARHPEIDVPVVPSDCGEIGGMAGDAAPPIPDGAYRADITLDELTAAEVSNANGYTGTWTMTIADGTWAVACRPNAIPDVDCGHYLYESEADYATVLEAGYLYGDDKTAQFVYDEELHRSLADCGTCGAPATKHVGWKLEGDQLTFSDIGEPVVDELLIIEPWTKVG